MSFDNLLQDVRLAVRSLLRTPAFTVVTILTLALGIGANTAIFSIVNGVILRPLGYPKPEQLMYLTTQFPAFGFDQFWVSPPEYFEFRELNQSFSAVGAFTTNEVNLTAGDRPMRVRSASVDDSLLTALGIQPVAGRLFSKGEADLTGPQPPPGAPPVPLPPIVILSHELWQRAFGGQPGIIGQTVQVNGLPREVIGIMPPGADVMDNRTEIWVPLGLNPANRQNRGSHFLYLVGRLKDGITPEAAQSELAALIQNWGERTGQKNHVFAPLPKTAEERKTNFGHILQMHAVQEQIVGGASRAIWVLQAAVGFVLLIACANLANLLLARAETRHREFAVRTALGAGRGQLLRQFMTEGVLLSIVGGVLGLVLAQAGLEALLRLYPASLPRTSEVGLDPVVLAFTFGVSLLTGLIFGLAPLMHTKVKGLALALKEGGARGATAGAARHHIRRGLVMLEVALAVMLVIGAGLMIRTVVNLATIDAGFERSRLVTFAISLPGSNYPSGPPRAQMYQRLLAKLRGVAGVQGASAMSGLPPNRPLNANDTDIDNYTAPPEGPFENVDYYQNVMSDYFETMGIPMVQGRAFQASDAASPGRVAIVNETLVNTFWKDLNPIGQRVRPSGPDAPWYTVIGVAKDVKQGGVDKKTGTELYLFSDQAATQASPYNFVPGLMNIVVRTTLPAATLRGTIEAAVREADPSIPVVRLQDMNAVFADSITRPRLLAQLLGGFAGLALLLAAIGTYGVLSYMVAERRREIGIRMALGADQGSVLAQVMKQGLTLTSVGLVVGLAGAFALNRLIASLLFGVQPTDITTIAAVVGTITLVAAVACWLPAWRASRVDPNIVLRDD
jgi:predicted permease